MDTPGNTAPRQRPPRLYATVVFLIAAALTYGGVQLVLLGGSAYYLITGVVLILSAILLWQGRRLGAWLYAAMLVGTILWAFAEVGFDGWALVPRIVAPAILGLWLLLPHVRRGLA